MREIKFRAWQPYSKTMHYTGYNFYITIGDPGRWLSGPMPWQGYTSKNNGMFSSCVYGNDPNTSLMQYTGLKDGNGTEIYEGDVIYFPQGSPQKYETKWDNERGGWVWGRIRADFDLKTSQRIEVIGNVFENPDLI